MASILSITKFCMENQFFVFEFRNQSNSLDKCFNHLSLDECHFSDQIILYVNMLILLQLSSV